MIEFCLKKKKELLQTDKFKTQTQLLGKNRGWRLLEGAARRHWPWLLNIAVLLKLTMASLGLGLGERKHS